MGIHVVLVACLDFAVIFLLLLGTNSLCGYPQCLCRALLAAAAGSVCCGACLLPVTRFLANGYWRLSVLAAVGLIAFGHRVSGLRRTGVFLILNLALMGIATGLHDGLRSALIAAACVAAVCILGMRGSLYPGKYIPVELSYGGKMLHILALRDTGNTLRDPVTGKAVLVIGADAAKELTGLTAEQLHNPLESIAAQLLPGLRLIPYRTVGQPCGMLLAVHLPQVRIGRYKGGSVVAFAPEIISTDGTYQALTGGTL